VGVPIRARGQTLWYSRYMYFVLSVYYVYTEKCGVVVSVNLYIRQPPPKLEKEIRQIDRGTYHHSSILFAIFPSLIFFVIISQPLTGDKSEQFRCASESAPPSPKFPTPLSAGGGGGWVYGTTPPLSPIWYRGVRWAAGHSRHTHI
jgi:hypothetical protein